MKLLPIQKELRTQASTQKRVVLARFFKTGKGEYAEGDQFLGVTVPESRSIVKRYREMSLIDLRSLLKSTVHEDRFVALCVLVHQYMHAEPAYQERIFKLYMKSIQDSINNWDLVDTSAEHIVGEYVFRTGKVNILYTLARSQSLWERRVAVIASFYAIKRKQSALTCAIAEMLLHDTHDLIHKAVGWMLREVGKRCSRKELIRFLDVHAHEMPRTMLRYSIEHLSPSVRKHYMKR